MIKVLTIVGTRPELIKLSCVIRELDKYTNHILAHTGQNHDYELNQVFFEDLEIRKPNYFMNAVDDSSIKTIGNILVQTDELIEQEKPDAVLIYGDTNSCLSAYSAKRKKVPIFHMEAGNRCFDQRVPEEINRKIIDHTSDINMTITEHARKYLLSEGIRPETVFKVGSSMKEVLNTFKHKINKSQILKEMSLKPNDYFLVSAHREENTDNPVNLEKLVSLFVDIAKTFQKRVIVSTHPRLRKKLENINLANEHPLIEFLKPFGFCDYITLQKNACCVISDSGTITEESSLLQFPAVTIREAHERPEGMDEGTLIMCGLNSGNTLHAIKTTIEQSKEKKGLIQIVPDYDVESVSHKVVRIILSYTNYINQKVWYKGT